MKKTICLFFALFATFLTVLKAEDESFNIGWTKLNSGNAFLIDAQDGTFMQVMKDASLTFSLDAAADIAGNISFGVDIYDADGTLSQQVFNNLTPGDVFSINFRAGQSLNFWMDIDGVRVGFIDGDASSLSSYFSSYDSSDPNQLGIAFRDERMSKFEGHWNTLINIEAGAVINAATSSFPISHGLLLAVSLTVAAILPFFLRRERLV